MLLGPEPEALVARADEALYIAKRDGKNRITLHHRERRRWVRYPARPEARIRVECGEEGAGRPAMGRGLILISLDTVSAEHLSLYGYQRQTSPFLDSLENGGPVIKQEPVPAHVESRNWAMP